MKKINSSRRKFIRNIGIGSAATAGLPLIAASCSDSEKATEQLNDFFNEGDVVLFQGDSITDAGRNRKKEGANNSASLGGGYAFLAGAKLLGALPEKKLKIHNRGISGNKVYQLAERWQKDCIDLKPNVLSILIGVNDYWHFRDGNYDGTPEIYEEDFRKLLKRTKKALPDVKIIICEPFILTETNKVDETWLEPFRPYQEIATKICKEFDAIWVPFQTAFSNSLDSAEATYWTWDGVHPSMAGAEMMANAWLEAVSKG